MVERRLTALIAGWDGSLQWRYAHLANAAALLWEETEGISWLGFYLTDRETGKLILGPFQGKVACTEIPIGKGVCGKAAELKKAILVPDVHAFEGHIVCDDASLSELVVPLIDPRGEVVGVLDIDSPLKGRFTTEDRRRFERYAKRISQALWS
ncbi:MAG: GAF domain-containing protein [Spirochaetales bacterium]|nr:GAF domain-containing protein [Spirochaetales bacterium]